MTYSMQTWSVPPVWISHRRLLGTLIISMLIFQAPTHAGQWKLEKNGEQYQMSIQSSDRDRLILSHTGEDTRFVLLTTSKQKQPDNRQMLQLWFDNESSIIETGLTRIKPRTYLIKLNRSQKNDILNQMVNKVDLHMRYLVHDRIYRDMEFSLIGFTAVLNDMLIAHDMGHLDPEWLNENHKTQELMCFYAANLSVQAMINRKRGLTYKNTIQQLKKRYRESLEEVINDIVKQVYAMPYSKLPRDPRGDKYGIFSRCMRRYQR